MFSDNLGWNNGSPIELNVTTQPSFFKARPVPYAMQSQVKGALDKMESNGVIKKVKSSSCAAPMVVVKKKNTEELLYVVISVLHTMLALILLRILYQG